MNFYVQYDPSRNYFTITVDKTNEEANALVSKVMKVYASPEQLCDLINSWAIEIGLNLKQR